MAKNKRLVDIVKASSASIPASVPAPHQAAPGLFDGRCSLREPWSQVKQIFYAALESGDSDDHATAVVYEMMGLPNPTVEQAMARYRTLKRDDTASAPSGPSSYDSAAGRYRRDGD